MKHENILMDIKIDQPRSIGRDSTYHRMLKANIKKKLKEMGSTKISYEESNLDVVSYDLGLIFYNKIIIYLQGILKAGIYPSGGILDRTYPV
jgi:hypothetical protein